MDSDDDMHDANDLESVDDYYSDDNDDCSNRDNPDIEDYGYIDDLDDDSDVLEAHRNQQSYTILNEHDIRQHQEDDITRVSTVLSISRNDAIILLRHFNWRVTTVHETWFADEDAVRKAVGLLERPLVQYHNSREITCGICFESYPRDKIFSAACGHPFCGTCWAGYMRSSIGDGPGCLSLRCPDPSCSAAIGLDMISSLAPDEDKKKYILYLLRSYIEDNTKTKWCPAPGCEYAVEFSTGSEVFDISCLCSYNFCWKCTEEAHRPVDCGTVSKWIMKNSVESENMNWILANSKPCPKCKRPIEKNQGCMHMTCTPPCKFEFCWLCLGAWSDHGERTGGFYACNRYEAAKQEGAAERRREMAKNSLERYTHYYERWASNQSSRQKAIADLNQMQTVHLEKLSDAQCQPESQLKFIIEAWQQIVECRRVLKWTYSYGYYLDESELAKKQFFEMFGINPSEAESGLERLHQCAEKELQQFLRDDGPSSCFNDFRTKLAGLTSVTKNYFENLVRALENGLSDVDSGGSSRVGGAGSSKNGGVGGSKATRSSSGSGKGKVSRGGSSSRTEELTHWACDHCTFANVKTATICQMCHQRRS